MCKGLLISHCHDHGHGHGYGVLGSEVAFLSSFVLISSFQQTIILSISPAFFFFPVFALISLSLSNLKQVTSSVYISELYNLLFSFPFLKRNVLSRALTIGLG